MSDFFDSNDFNDWKKVTKSISDHLRDHPNTSNPSKLMAVIADKFGFENTKAFKSHVDSLFSEDKININVEALFQLGSYKQICDYIESEINSEKPPTSEKTEKAIWLAKNIAFFFFSRKHDEYDTDFSYLHYLDQLTPKEVASRARIEMVGDNPNHPIHGYSKSLNIWYSSLPGNPQVIQANYLWDSNSEIKKSTINAIEKAINPVIFPLVKNSSNEDVVNYNLFKNAFDSWINLSLSYCRYSALIVELTEGMIEDKSSYDFSDLINSLLSSLDAENPQFLDFIVEYAPHPFKYNRDRFLKMTSCAIYQKILFIIHTPEKEGFVSLDAELDDFYKDDDEKENKRELKLKEEERQKEIKLFKIKFPDHICYIKQESILKDITINPRYVFLIDGLPK